MNKMEDEEDMEVLSGGGMQENCFEHGQGSSFVWQ